MPLPFDTTINFYRDVPVDKDYKHCYAGNIGNALTRAYYVTKNSYQRLRKNTIRVQKPISEILQCNYLSFTNAGHENFTYYAFITEVNYINDSTTEIVYELDVMSTYFNLYRCEGYIEREHSTTDAIGDNLVPENISVDALQINNISTVGAPASDTQWRYYIFYIPQKNVDKPIIEVDGTTVSDREAEYYDYCTGIVGCFIGAAVVYIDGRTVFTVISEVIQKMIEKGNTIVGMYSTPNMSSLINQSFGLTMSFKKAGKSTSTYSPHNYKLYTYPYREICVSNNAGQMNHLKWELTATHSSFHYDVIFHKFPQAETSFIPNGYRGLSNSTMDFANSLTINDYPSCCWSEDSFTRWWSQNKVNVVLNGISAGMNIGDGVANAFLGGYSGNYGQMASGIKEAGQGTMQAAGIGGKIYAEHRTPDTFSGTVNAQLARLTYGYYGFTLYDLGITGEQAEYLDNYFDMFGYAQNKIGAPWAYKGFGSNARKWCYVKMSNTNISPTNNGVGMSAEDQQKIESIFNRGTTFWKSYANVGDYSVGNSIH